jgi:hypothetical protein
MLVASCDAYSDLWRPYFAVLDRYWADCPFPIALVTEAKRPEFKGVKALRLGQGLDWSSLMVRALDALSTRYVLLTLEDFFLRETVDSARVLRLLEEVKKDSLNMLRLIPRPGPPRGRLKTSHYGLLPVNAPYRVSTQAAFWRVDVLRNLLVEGENAWQFEVNGSVRSHRYQGFASVWDAALPYRHHAVERGRWFPWAVLRFRYLDIAIDLRARPVMTIPETSRWVLSKLTAGVVTRVPRNVRSRLRPLAKRTGMLP